MVHNYLLQLNTRTLSHLELPVVHASFFLTTPRCCVAHRQSDKEFLQGTMNYPTSAIIAGFQRLNYVREVFFWCPGFCMLDGNVRICW